ncbi:MAG: recombinase family protein [Spirulinaceae cyanobacterium SM2_1_0]|nr:recombinase family protein [Spirulinaceae cyanobacterium SM2_1_0]
MRIALYAYREPLLDTATPVPVPNLAIACEYRDWGDRHQWQQLLAEAHQQPLDYVWVQTLAALGADLAEVRDRLAALQALEIELLIATDAPGSAAPLNDQSVASPDFIALLSEVQAEQRRRALRLGHARNRVRALPPPGKAAYGYRRGRDRYILDRSTAPVVKAFFERYLLYGSLRGAVRYLEQKFGKKISPTTGRRWLSNPVYRGDTAYGTGETIPDTHAAILSREEAAQLDRLRRRNQRLPPRTASAPRSLAGLVRCAACHSPLHVARVTPASSKKAEYLYLRPATCPQQPHCPALPYEAVLQATIAGICAEVPAAVAAIAAPDPSAMQAAIAIQSERQQVILAQLPILEAQGILDPETAALRRYKLQTELADLQAKVDQLPPANLAAIATTISLPQFWLDLSEPERRFYLREFVQQVLIVRSPDGHWQVQIQFIF